MYVWVSKSMQQLFTYKYYEFIREGKDPLFTAFSYTSKFICGDLDT